MRGIAHPSKNQATLYTVATAVRCNEILKQPESSRNRDFWKTARPACLRAFESWERHEVCIQWEDGAANFLYNVAGDCLRGLETVPHAVTTFFSRYESKKMVLPVTTPPVASANISNAIVYYRIFVLIANGAAIAVAICWARRLVHMLSTTALENAL